MKNLIPLSDFVLEQLGIKQYTSEFKEVVRDYTLFLKQPLKLEMFVPCDEDGNILKEPHLGMFHDNRTPLQDLNIAKIAYETAKEKVLFEDAVTIDTTPYYQTKRILIDLKLNNSSTIRIYSHFIYSNGREEKTFMPNFKEIPTVEFLAAWGLTLTPSALNKIGIKE